MSRILLDYFHINYISYFLKKKLSNKCFFNFLKNLHDFKFIKFILHTDPTHATHTPYTPHS